MFKKIAMIGALLSGTMAAPAFAQHLTPANTDFTAVGLVEFTKAPSTSLTCTLTLTGRTGPDLGSPHANHADTATITGGTNTGAGCENLTVDPGDITHVSGNEWVLTPTIVKSGGIPICDGAVHFTVEAGGFIDFDSDIAASSVVPGTCHVLGELETSPTISNVN